VSSSSAAPDPIEIAGRYEVEKKLGAGAFGTVFKAKDRELGRMVAIKTIRLEGLAASSVALEDLVKRFKKEAQVAARLRHPNIVTLYDIGTWEGMSYISMEFVDGVGLDRVIKGSGKMAVERAAAIGAQVADALAVAHKAGIVHRDIKPANIMIEPGDHVKVTDFGIAKMTDSADHLTVTGALLGTPSYMSPEQAKGGNVDGRSDLFSVGCVLYEMVAGERAFRGDSITALLFKIITEEPPSLRELDPTVSDEMLRIIGKALSKAPENRYQNGRELADDLLAVTRPGFVPTLRVREAPTLPPDAPPADVPTLQSPPTARTPETIASRATAPSVPPVPATVLTPATARTTPPPIPDPTTVLPPTGGVPPLPTAAPAAKAPATARAARPTQAERRSGGGAGLVIGLGLVGVLLLALLAGGAYFMLRRSPPADQPTVTTEATAAPTSLPTAAPSFDPAREQPTSTSAEATPPTVAEAPATPPPALTQRTATSQPPATATTRAASHDPPARSGTAAVAPPSDAPAGGDDYSHLDDLPADEPDGRAAGEALAGKYRSGGSGSYSTTRFRERPRVPRGVTVQERPAVATLFYIHTVQQAYHRSHGRYGSLAELKGAGLLALDVPLEPSGFRRARYAFRVEVQPDGYRADATPLAPIGRAFVVDDAGKVRLPDE
jgi:serine/threonine-protein kinase